jgi:hypothetical protein
MSRETLLQILDIARWAPSGDNTQPWRFEIIDDNRIAIHGHDTRKNVIYDFDGHCSHLAHGALLETLRLAATRFGLKADWSLREGCPDDAPIYDVTLQAAEIQEDPLVRFIETRCVQRRPMRTTSLTATQKEALSASVGNSYTLQFLESFADRLAVAQLLWDNAHLRLTCPEAFQVHREVIEWNARFSSDRIPDQALGIDPLTARVMKWVMHSWERVCFFNRYLGGTIAPRVQMDFIPAMGCASHILIHPKQSPVSLQDRLLSGIALQRFWLTASSLELHLQPEMTPLIFRWYVRAGRPISQLANINEAAVALSGKFEEITGADMNTPYVFFCRVGSSKEPRSRSLRKKVEALLTT